MFDDAEEAVDCFLGKIQEAVDKGVAMRYDRDMKGVKMTK
jgi:hypothetical protein